MLIISAESARANLSTVSCKYFKILLQICKKKWFNVNRFYLWEAQIFYKIFLPSCSDNKLILIVNDESVELKDTNF